MGSILPQKLQSTVGWSIMMCLGIIILTILALSIPHWVVLTRSSTSWGLFNTCNGADCSRNDFTGDVGLGTKCAGTPREGSKLQSRMDATAAMLFLAFFPTFGLWIVLVLHANKKFIILNENTQWFATIASVFPVVFTMIGLSIAGNTFGSWLGCGKSVCDAYASMGATNFYCGWGYSFTIAIITFFLLVILMVVMIVFSVLKQLHQKDGLYPWLIAGFAICSLFLLIALSSAHFFEVGSRREKYGLFRQCSNDHCNNANDFNAAGFTKAGCNRKNGDYKDRLRTTQAFLFLNMFGFIALFVFQLLRLLGVGGIAEKMNNVLRIVFAVCIGVGIAFTLIAIAVYGAIWDSWLYCGSNFCAMQKKSTECGFGFSMAAAILIVFLEIAALLLQLLELWKGEGVVASGGSEYPATAGGETPAAKETSS